MSSKLRKGVGATLREQLISLGLITESEKKMENNTDPSKGTVTRPPQGGIKADHWFWAALDVVGTKPPMEEKTAEPTELPPSSDVQTDIGQLLTENPGIAGATFYNLLKSKGWQFVAPKFQAEADVSSAQPVGVLAAEKQKESSVPRGTMKFRARFLESTPRGDSSKQGLSFRCILLQEGLGNLRDAYYYSKESLVSAVPIFEGKKIYADHPSALDEQVRPERSVRDVLGHFENVAIEEIEGVTCLVGDVKILPDQSFEWARALMRHSVDYAQKYPDKDFIGLSINAGGDAEEADIGKVMESAPGPAKLKLEQAKSEGINKVRLVSKITEAVSCDLVTEAGAGGKIVTMLESDKPTEEREMEKQIESELEKKEAIAPAADGEKPAAKHEDEEQDIELIKKMIAEYLGDEEHSEETLHAAKQAHDAAKGIGLEGEEAYKQAGMMMKMARHMKSKHAEDEAKKESEGEDEKKIPEKKEDEACEEAKGCEDEKKEDEAKHKESAELIKLRGENAALVEKLTAYDNERFLDKMLRESRLPMSMTKKFREALGEKIPSKREDIETKFKLFREGIQAAGEGDLLGALVIQPEKRGEVKGSVDFSDCVS